MAIFILLSYLYIYFLVGFLKDRLGNYTVAFICAGIPPIVGSLLMCFIYRAKQPTSKEPIIEINNLESQYGEKDVRNNPIIKINTPNGHTQSNTPTMSYAEDSGSKLYPNLTIGVNHNEEENHNRHPEDSEAKPLV